MITVVFQPYAAKALLHIPVHLFHGKDVAMDEVEDVELSDLAKQVHSAGRAVSLYEKQAAYNRWGKSVRKQKLLHHPAISNKCGM